MVDALLERPMYKAGRLLYMVREQLFIRQAFHVIAVHFRIEAHYSSKEDLQPSSILLDLNYVQTISFDIIKAFSCHSCIPVLLKYLVGGILTQTSGTINLPRKQVHVKRYLEFGKITKRKYWPLNSTGIVALTSSIGLAHGKSLPVVGAVLLHTEYGMSILWRSKVRHSLRFGNDLTWVLEKRSPQIHKRSSLPPINYKKAAMARLRCRKC